MITLQLAAGQQTPAATKRCSHQWWRLIRAPHRHPEYPAHIRGGFIRILQPTIPAANIDHLNNGLTFHTHLCPLTGSLITIKPCCFFFIVLVLYCLCVKLCGNIELKISNSSSAPKIFILRTQSTTVYLLISEAVRGSSSYNHLPCVGAH